MKTAIQVATSSVLGLALMALTLFWPAGTIHYWQAWVFFGMFVGLSVIFTAYTAIRNPEVLRRRMNAGPQHESRPVQKVVSTGVCWRSLPYLSSRRSIIGSAGPMCRRHWCSSGT